MKTKKKYSKKNKIRLQKINKTEFINKWNDPNYSLEDLIKEYDLNRHLMTDLKHKWNLPRKTVKQKDKNFTNVKKQKNLKKNKYWNSKSDEFVVELSKKRNIGFSSTKGYDSCIKHYVSFQKKFIYELIEEALEEQDNHVPMRESKLKKRLLNYREYLLNESNLNGRTARTYFSKIKTVYITNDCEIPILPDVKYDLGYVTTYNDLPTHQHLKEALLIAQNLEMQSLILLQSSGGFAKAEAMSLTIQQFIDGVSPYLETRIEDEYSVTPFLIELNKRLKNKEIIVPTFYLARVKNGKFYYGFCSPETTEMICKYLQVRWKTVNDLDVFLNQKIIKSSNSLILTHFQEINDKMNWGFKGKYRFFRSHVLRKFNASNIGMITEDIDAIQGRGKNEVHEAYIKTKPDELKQRYIEHMWRVCLDDEWITACKKLDKSQNIQDVNLVETKEEQQQNNMPDINQMMGVMMVKMMENMNTQNQPQQNNNSFQLEDLLKYGQLVKEGLLTKAEFDKIKASIIGGL